MNPFSGLSAFPLTPLHEQKVDEGAFAVLVERAVEAGVDSISVLGSTGSYAYLNRSERALVTRLAVSHAGGVPVIAGIGAVRTRDVLEFAEDAQAAGVAGVLLAPVSYQALTPDDVFGFYEEVTVNLSVPLVVYDNPSTTHFSFPRDLYRAITMLPKVASIKIPGVPPIATDAASHVASLREILPPQLSIGVSGDVFGATGLSAGCDVWYSGIGGTLPERAVEITRAAQAGDAVLASELSEQLRPIWQLFAAHGSIRVVAAIAEELGLASRSCLPLPIRGLTDEARADVLAALNTIGVTA